MQVEDANFLECRISPSQIHSPNAPSESWTSSSCDDSARICVVCMDRERDVALKPCDHNSCCATCFLRLDSRKCPICRSPAQAAHFLGTNRVLSRLRFCAPEPTAEATGRPSAQPETPYVYTRRFHQHTFQSESRFSERRSRASSTESVATQAASSLRSNPSLRSPALQDMQCSENRSNPNYLRQNAETSSHLFSSLLSIDGNQTLACSTQPRNIVLLGQSRTLMISLLTRLRTIFPPPAWEDPKIYQKNRSLLYVQNEPMRLVLLERRSDALDIEPFLSCIRQYSPQMILLCANFFNLSSFESVVRLDLEVLDFLNVPCMWVLIKTDRAKESKLSNRVENTDVSAAKHFVASPRRCFIATVDAVFPSDVRKLGLEIRFSVWRDSATRLATPRSSSMRNLNLKRSIFRKLQRSDSGQITDRGCFNFSGRI